MPCDFSGPCLFDCDPRGGNGCAENCTSETTVAASFTGASYRTTIDGRALTLGLAGAISFAEGKAANPPPPPCMPAAVRLFTARPIDIAGGSQCVCVRGYPNAIAYGAGNVGVGIIGCAGAPNVMRADLHLQTWVLPTACAPGQPADGPDGEPCTADDAALSAATLTETQFACAGDCDLDGMVTVNELLQGVGIALGNAPLSDCPSLDRNADGIVTVDEVLLAVNNALLGCQGLTILPTPTPTS